MKKKIVVFLALWLTSALLFSCGTRQESTGAEKDTVSATNERPPFSGSDSESTTQTAETASAGTESDTRTTMPKAFRSSGSFASETGTHMNLTVNWTAESEDGIHITLTLDAVLNCYSIEVGARPGMGKLTVGNAEYDFSTPALRQEENKKTSFEFFTRTLTLTAGASPDGTERGGLTVLPDGSFSLPVKVVWPFNGVYGKKQISDITAAAVLQFGVD